MKSNCNERLAFLAQSLDKQLKMNIELMKLVARTREIAMRAYLGKQPTPEERIAGEAELSLRNELPPI